jgi:hypothetical protein
MELASARRGRKAAVRERGVRQQFHAAIGLIVWCHRHQAITGSALSGIIRQAAFPD